MITFNIRWLTLVCYKLTGVSLQTILVPAKIIKCQNKETFAPSQDFLVLQMYAVHVY